jgi:hypothetical protein
MHADGHACELFYRPLTDFSLTALSPVCLSAPWTLLGSSPSNCQGTNTLDGWNNYGNLATGLMCALACSDDSECTHVTWREDNGACTGYSACSPSSPSAATFLIFEMNRGVCRMAVREMTHCKCEPNLFFCLLSFFLLKETIFISGKIGRSSTIQQV